MFEYLHLHHASVTSIPVTSNLLQLKSTTKNLHAKITTIAEVSKISSCKSLPASGGHLLTYLLSAAEKINKKFVQNVLFGIIKTCCEVYFR